MFCVEVVIDDARPAKRPTSNWRTRPTHSLLRRRFACSMSSGQIGQGGVAFATNTLNVTTVKQSVRKWRSASRRTATSESRSG